mmetsp:Transcript_845/g.2389  ORF Transcript_845/g.2389 Transcript_845/m.2389 type:complete len:232 (+) Transcript_845:1669-2364(+)
MCRKRVFSVLRGYQPVSNGKRRSKFGTTTGTTTSLSSCRRTAMSRLPGRSQTLTSSGATHTTSPGLVNLITRKLVPAWVCSASSAAASACSLASTFAWASSTLTSSSSERFVASSESRADLKRSWSCSMSARGIPTRRRASSLESRSSPWMMWPTGRMKVCVLLYSRLWLRFEATPRLAAMRFRLMPRIGSSSMDSGATRWDAARQPSSARRRFRSTVFSDWRKHLSFWLW